MTIFGCGYAAMCCYVNIAKWVTHYGGHGIITAKFARDAAIFLAKSVRRSCR